MKHLALVALSSVLASVAILGATRAGAAAAEIPAVTETWLNSRTLDLSFRSAEVNEKVGVRVLLPQGWSRTPGRTWPVVYAFHGGNETYTGWSTKTDILKLAAPHDLMVVMPSGGSNGSYADWWNDGKGGTPRWESFHTRELPEIMARYGAGDRRAVIGASSGGQGAMVYAARHPGMYRHAASFSSPTHITMDGMRAGITFINMLGLGADAFRIYGRPGRDDANWRAHDPYHLAAGLRGTGLYVSSGTTGLNGPHTPPGSIWRLTQLSEVLVGRMNKAFVARLNELGIPVTSHIYGHGWHAWPEVNAELKNAWPLILRSLTT
ncbi:alpha/beta hydrolase [Thermomonospora umbrina]|uniref:S-formylglutathione hydrolase FrmB n=1 Tax=Thermomonospora umbrina TaxID=111806 RepID=A0A3D9T5C6_9ACTN|nr:alpha/beta hydrolase family protein [Thermomonospora umbrina]REE99914.1 S-formylglutathione hydrolase FrmB [Thermomonospora umbrina]